MATELVKEGAILTCSLGTVQTELQVPKFHGTLLKGGNPANVGDNVGNVNILPFGECARSIPKPPCSPLIVTKWVKGQKNTMLDGDLVLIKESIVPCMYGGIISIVTSGQ
jgi:hypothetical protein